MAAEPQPDMGTIMTRLAQPVAVGEVTAGEANEIKVRNGLLESLEAKIKAAREDAGLNERLHLVARNEKSHFIRSVCTRRGLDVEAADYNVDLDSGQIFKTAERTPQQLEEIAEGKAVAEEGRAIAEEALAASEAEPEQAEPEQAEPTPIRRAKKGKR